MTTERVLGFCTSCTRVRWLALVTNYDKRGNPHGICHSCDPVRAFPIIDEITAKHALLWLYQPANDKLRAKRPEVEQRVLARAAKFGVHPPGRGAEIKPCAERDTVTETRGGQSE